MNDLFSQLPENDPRPDLWNRIDKALNDQEDAQEAPFQHALDNLPQYEPDAGMWTAIESQLAEPSALKRFPFTVHRSAWQWLSVAAVVLLVGSWLLIRLASTEQVHMEYATETARPVPALPAPVSSDEEAFIARQCAQQLPVCQRPEVHELRNQLASLAIEEERIQQEQQTFGDDPALIRAQIKVANQRAEVTRELITLLRS
ncbi:hypothetical protein [Spirosoma sp. KUDC1026]|uniref:hypothetical protein n=1 Tax=Spirosoma sp. KUDC1026 TaxID=2745947 RepID=UPI00159BBF6F|nr:hypothetical protein [Spirosoma sp. KUDC1026]QKZ11584.1 hypothetical protein HU175_02640 [Spirosoma sp. KUDC1026]